MKTKENKGIRSEKGSITVFVLSTLLVALMILITVYVGIANKLNSQKNQVDKIAKEYNVTDEFMEETYSQIIDSTEDYSTDVDSAQNGDLVINAKILKFLKRELISSNVQLNYFIKSIKNGKEVYSNVMKITASKAGVSSIVIKKIPRDSETTVEAIYTAAQYSLSTEKKITKVMKENEINNVDFEYKYNYKNITSSAQIMTLKYNGITWNEK